MINIADFRKHAGARATGLNFISSGLIFGTWAAMIPFIKVKFQLDEAELGLLLLAPPAGIMMANPLSVYVMRKFGAVRTSLGAMALAALALILPVMVPSVWMTGLSLIFLGVCLSILNIAMNTCAAILEQKAGLSIFSTCHGLWSSGAMLGAAIAGTVTSGGVPAPVYVVFFSLGILLVALGLRKPMRLVPEHQETAGQSGEPESAGFRMPNAALWLLIIIGLSTNLTEGAMSDWAAVFMREVIGFEASTAAWGFAVYAFFMAGGRFLGDGIIARVGARRALRAGGFIALTGMLPAVFWHHPVAVLVGFALVGAGVSLGAPILYAASARVPGMAKGAGLAIMNTFAMASFLGGPALIGFIAKASSLPIAFGVVATLILVWIWKAGKISY